MIQGSVWGKKHILKSLLRKTGFDLMSLTNHEITVTGCYTQQSEVPEKQFPSPDARIYSIYSR